MTERQGDGLASAQIKADGLPLITIRPGHVMHIWRDGKQTEAVQLSDDALRTLIRDLVNAMWHQKAETVPNGTQPEHERG